MAERTDYKQFYSELGKKKKDFNAALDHFADSLVPAAVADFTALTALNVYNKVTNKSPVDTGQFQANWNITPGKEADLTYHEDFSRNDSPSKSTAEAAKAIDGLKPFEAVSISNNLDYAGSLERGHSNQAPLGVLGLSLDETVLWLESQKKTELR